MRLLYALIFWLIIGAAAVFGVAWSGAYPPGADVPHWAVTLHFITWARNRAIDRRSADLRAPPLDDPALVRDGARLYAQTCVNCHLAPGLKHSDLREGLYPQPPDLTRFAPTTHYAFWVIKHGLKMTAMPAWGKSHDDQAIWALVAYLQKQPKMSVETFRELTTPANPQ